MQSTVVKELGLLGIQFGSLEALDPLCSLGIQIQVQVRGFCRVQSVHFSKTTACVLSPSGRVDALGMQGSKASNASLHK